MKLSAESPYPPAMLIGLVAGMEPKYDVAARYGVSSAQLDTLMDQPAFKAALAKAKELVDLNGVDEEMMAFSVLQGLTSRVVRDLYTTYMNRDTPTDTKVRIANALFARENQLRQRVHPAKQVQGGDGAGFTININLPASVTGAPASMTLTLPIYQAERGEVFDAMEVTELDDE